MKAGFPTVGVMVTVCVADNGPPQPEATAVITDVPLHEGLKVTCPVTELIELPPVMLALSRL